MKAVALLIAVLALGVSSLRAAEFKGGPFPNWTDDTVLKLLVDSPWAHARTVKVTWYGKRGEAEAITYKDVPGTRPGMPASSTVQGGSPVGGIGGGKIRNKLPDQADLIFRWATALPVRQAKTLYRARQQQQQQPSKAVEARQVQAGFVFEIFGLPAVAGHAGVEALSARLAKSTVLRSKNGRIVLRAERAETVVTGEQLAVSIFFPRPEGDPLRVEDQEVTCSGNAGELFSFEERFRLRDMVYLGSLEL